MPAACHRLLKLELHSSPLWPAWPLFADVRDDGGSDYCRRARRGRAKRDRGHRGRGGG